MHHEVSRSARVALAALTVLMVSGPFVAGGGETGDCATGEAALTVAPGEEVTVGGTSYAPLARWGGHTEGGLSLAFDMLVRPVDRATGEPRRGAYVPHLSPGYRIVSGDRVLADGKLAFRLSSRGPAYGLDAVVAGEALRGAGLHVEVDLGTALIVPLSGSTEPSPSGAEAASSERGVDSENESLRVARLGALDPRSPDAYNDIWGYHAGGVHLAILGGENGTSFIDVSDPASPVEVGYVEGPSSSWRDIATFDTYAYIVTEGVGTGEGMQIVDLSDPLTPTLVDTYTETFVTAHNVFVDVPAARLYAVGTDNGTRILDLSEDPSQPTEIGSWTDRYVHDAYAADGRAFFSEVNDGLHEILDATDPQDLQVLASWPTPEAASHNSWANEDQSITLTTDEVTGGIVNAYDTSDLFGEIPLLGAYDPAPTTVVHNVVLDDEDDQVAVISHYGIGAHLVDIRRPTAPVQLGFYDTYPSGDTGFNGCWGVYPFDPRGLIYASDIQTGLYVLEYQPTGGTLSGVVREAGTGDPISGARVTVLADGREASSGEGGVYALYAPAGRIQLRVTAPAYRTRLVEAGSLEAGERLDVDVNLSALASGPLSGTVVQADDGSPVEGATVEVPSLGLEVLTGADGTFSFPEVAVGDRVVTASKFGFASAETRTVAEAVGVEGVELRLTRAAFADDAESNEGWTLGLAADGATSGRWERVDPNGTDGGAVQPEDDHTPDPGLVAFITGQQAPGQSSEANDVDGGQTTLLSPPIDASDLDAARLEFFRWVSTEGGLFSAGGTLVAEVSDDDGASWTPLESVGENVNRWTGRGFDLGSFVDLTGSVRVRFVAQPNDPFSWRVLEAGVDDVQVVSACRARFNPGLSDADRDGQVDACDPCPGDPLDDGDADGVCGDADNAPFVPNADQADADGDGVGDAADLCPTDSDPAQRDLDGDGTGDACDDDVDGDGLAVEEDPDRDGDGVDNQEDGCPLVPDALQRDRDADGEGDACDADDDHAQGVRVEAQRVEWEPEQGPDSYNLYRGDLGAEALLALAGCRLEGAEVLFAVDPDLPKPGDGFFYLISTVDGGAEGGLGEDSSGQARQIDDRCQ